MRSPFRVKDLIATVLTGYVTFVFIVSVKTYLQTFRYCLKRQVRKEGRSSGRPGSISDEEVGSRIFSLWTSYSRR